MRPMVAATAAKIKTASHTEFLTVPVTDSTSAADTQKFQHARATRPDF